MKSIPLLGCEFGKVFVEGGLLLRGISILRLGTGLPSNFGGTSGVIKKSYGDPFLIFLIYLWIRNVWSALCFKWKRVKFHGALLFVDIFKTGRLMQFYNCLINFTLKRLDLGKIEFCGREFCGRVIEANPSRSNLTISCCLRMTDISFLGRQFGNLLLLVQWLFSCGRQQMKPFLQGIICVFEGRFILIGVTCVEVTGRA